MQNHCSDNQNWIAADFGMEKLCLKNLSLSWWNSQNLQTKKSLLFRRASRQLQNGDFYFPKATALYPHRISVSNLNALAANSHRANPRPPGTAMGLPLACRKAMSWNGDHWVRVVIQNHYHDFATTEKFKINNHLAELLIQDKPQKIWCFFN